MKARKTTGEIFEQALLFEQSGRSQEAAALYRKVISRSAEHDRALFRLSVILLEAGLTEEASRYLERAVELRRSEPSYLTNLGEAYRRQGKLELAEAVLTFALQLEPDLPAAHQNLALTLTQAGLDAQALPHLERAVELRPDQALARVSLAWLLVRMQRPVEALAQAERAVELAPNLAAAHRQLGDAADLLADKPRSLACYRRALELDPADHVGHSNLIMSLLTDPASDAAAIGAEARAWAQRHAEPLRRYQEPHRNDEDPERRLRLGYVSPDFRAHPLYPVLSPVLRAHDHEAVEIFLYSAVERADARTEWYRAWAGDRFRRIEQLGDVEAAELVRRDGIDILVDLAVHGAGNRLRVFACKPAPVQLTWLGYAGTTGLTAIDYRLTDPYFDPPGTDLGVYSERTLALPATFWCYEELEADLPVAPLSALARGFVTFGCLNSSRKLHPGVIALWARVLAAVPESRLLLYLEEYGRGAVTRAFAEAGIGAERIDFVGRVARRPYLERYHGIDIGLDTFPFAGGSTTLDAAWMGVPVVTLAGPATLQRGGTSIAHNLDLPELVAGSEDDFVERAASLARDREHLRTLRAGLRARLSASPIGDARGFTRALEAAYRTVWREYCATSRT